MLRQISISLLLVAAVSLPARASTQPMSQTQLATIQAALDRATLGNSPPMPNDGSYQADSRLPQIPSFSYAKGTPLAQAIPAAVLMMIGAKDFSPISATQTAGGDPQSLQLGTLAQLPFIKKLPLANIIAANPQLSNLVASTVFPGWSAAGNRTLGQLANGPIGSRVIPANILSNTPLSNLPGIGNTSFGSYPGIGSGVAIPGITAADLPGIPQLPMSNLVSLGNIPAGLQVMKIDTVHTGEPKLSLADRVKVTSGSNKEPNAPCTSGNCGGVELLSALDPHNNSNPLNGVYGLSGMRLKGGEGLLGDVMTAAGVREPSGFKVPYIGINGCGSTISFESPNANNGTVTQQLNLRFCYYLPFLGLQASPYFIPVPLPLPASEQQANLLLPMEVNPPILSPISPPNSSSNSTVPFITNSTPSNGSSSTTTIASSTVPFITNSTPSTTTLIGSNVLIPTWSPTLGNLI